VSGTVRVDWQAIKARWGSQVGDFHLALLPKGACQLLLAIADRLHWEATYRIEGYDYSDWDELQEIVDLGLGGLTDTVRLADLLAHVDELEPILRQIRDRPCCGESPLDALPNPNPGAGTIAPIGPDEDVPDIFDETELIGTPPQTPWTDWDQDEVTTSAEMEDYLCRAFNWYYDLLMRWLTYIKVYAQLGGMMWEPIDAILTLVLSRYKGLPSWVTMGQELADVLFTLWPDITTAIADDLIAHFEANRAEILCSLVGQTTMADIWTILSASIETGLSALGYSSLSAVVSWPTFALALATHGWVDLDDQNNVCSCAVQSVTYTYDEDPEGFIWYTHPGLVPTGTTHWIIDRGNPPGCLAGIGATVRVAISPVINAAQHDQIKVTAQWNKTIYGAQRQPRVALYTDALVLIEERNTSGTVSGDVWITRSTTFEHSGSGPIRVGLFTTSAQGIHVDNVHIEFLETL